MCFLQPSLFRTSIPALLLLLSLQPACRRDAAAAMERHRPAVDKLLAQIRSESAAHGHAALGELCTSIGARPCGSPTLEKAVDWAQTQMKAAGLENVRAEPVRIPHWIRGAESCELLSPARRPLAISSFGLSQGTPKGGLEADVVAVSTLAELAKLPEATVKGRIVLLDVPFDGYLKTLQYRVDGPYYASEKGAVACLLRSLSTGDPALPHTGVTFASIPGAALSAADATLLHQQCDQGQRVRIRLRMGATILPDAQGANVVGELRGDEKPEEVVLLSAHLDSWDVGQGAQDGGVGCLLALESLRAMQKAGLHPKRTIRVVFFTADEYADEWGARGVNAYVEAHASEQKRLVATLESSGGNGRCQGFLADPSGSPRGQAVLEQSRAFLEPLGVARVDRSIPGKGVAKLASPTTAGIELNHDQARYFDLYHSSADTFDRVDAGDFSHNLEAFAVAAYLLAEQD